MAMLHQLPNTNLPEIDPITLYKNILAELRTNLSNIFSNIAKFIDIQSGKSFDLSSMSDTISKDILNIYNMLEQMEINLKLAMELCIEASDSHRHTPFNIIELSQYYPPLQQQLTISLHNYTAIAHGHNSAVDYVQNILMDFSKAIGKSSLYLANINTSALTHTQPLQHQNIPIQQISRSSTMPQQSQNMLQQQTSQLPMMQQNPTI